MRTGLDIAVIGGGIAGLSAAWRLSARHRVTLLEKHPVVGMDAHSLDLPHDGRTARVDVPLRVIYEGYYPTLIGLYHALGVQLERTNYAGSFSTLHGATYFRYANWIVGGRSIPLPARPLGARALRINRDLLRFYRMAPTALADLGASEEPLGSWLDRAGLGSDFTDGFLIPTFAAVCTCSTTALRAYPARIILDYLTRGLTFGGVRRVVLGTREVVRRLTEPLAEVRCGVAVRRIAPTTDGVQITWDGGAARFDQVVLATQANQAARMLDAGFAREREALERFGYESSEVVVHTDPRLAPRDRRHWAPVNMVIDPQGDRPMATIWMNRVQPSLAGGSPVFQTWNPIVEPGASRVYARASFERPIVNARALEGARLVERLHGDRDRRLWFAGSYLGPGIPLLESATATAATVAAQIDDGA
jgi:predicted NAD/FAD-binding protein